MDGSCMAGEGGSRSRIEVQCNLARPGGGTDDLVASLTEHLIMSGRTHRVRTYDSKVVLDEGSGDVDPAGKIQYSVEFDDDCHMRVTLESGELQVAEVLDYLQVVHSEREDLPANRLFYFQQKHVETQHGTHRMERPHPSLKYASAPPRLSFQRRTFHTNKTFVSLHGPPVRTVQARVDFFRGRRDWYDARGVPYQLGMLFTGKPGCGKSSVVKAMAASMGRHVVSVDMGTIMTTAQLQSLFYDDTLCDVSGAKGHTVRVPQERRLYVIEEVDKSGGVLLESAPSTKDHESQVSLRDVLDVLDGGVESPGRVLVMTANDPSKLHPLVRRPGRLDFVVDFGPVNDAVLTDIFRRLRDAPPGGPLPGAGVLTPAEVTEAVLATLDKEEAAARGALQQLCDGHEVYHPST